MRPPGYETALEHFRAHGWGTEDLVDVGLVNKRDDGGFYDKFRNRMMFPIRDAAGKMAGFGARILDPNDMPKFLNSPQTALFDKSHLLYGLNLARKPIRAAKPGGHRGRLPGCDPAAPGGVCQHGLSHGHSLERRSTPIAQQALPAASCWRWTPMLPVKKPPCVVWTLPATRWTHETELVFDAHGLLRHEARLQADVRVTTLPPGMDPDEVVLRDPEEWQQIVASAKPIVVHVMETLAKSQDLERCQGENRHCCPGDSAHRGCTIGDRTRYLPPAIGTPVEGG